jgi:hypothetical protein
VINSSPIDALFPLPFLYDRRYDVMRLDILDGGVAFGPVVGGRAGTAWDVLRTTESEVWERYIALLVVDTNLALEEFLPHTGLTHILRVQILPLSPVIVRIIKKLEMGQWQRWRWNW